MTRLCRTIVLAAVACGGPSAAAEPPTSLLEAPAPIGVALESRFGKDLRILRLEVRAEGAAVEVQDRAVPSHVDRYTFEEGALGAPEPVAVGRNRRALDARLFAYADVDLSILPSLLQDAQHRAQTEDARATYVSIERTEGSGEYSSWSRPRIRVLVDGPRGGAVVEYGLDGKHKAVTRW